MTHDPTRDRVLAHNRLAPAEALRVPSFDAACELLRPGATAALRGLCPGGRLDFEADDDRIHVRYTLDRRGAVVGSADITTPESDFSVRAALAQAVGDLTALVAAARTELAKG